MPISVDFSSFYLYNVSDACAIWNLLSSRILYARARSAGCSFCLTHFVLYECLHKRRSSTSQQDQELKSRLQHEYDSRKIPACYLDIEDLQQVALLESRRRLSKGELSAIAFAKKTRQAFHTDDQAARRLAAQILAGPSIQTTPHLLGWLCFMEILSDGDKDEVIKEHESLGRPLRPHFDAAYNEALRCRLMVRKPPSGAKAMRPEKGIQSKRDGYLF